MRKQLRAFTVMLIAVFLLAGEFMWAQTSVTTWGFYGGRTGGWKVSVPAAGSVTISGDSALKSWSAVRGGFNTITPTTAANGAIVVTGKMEFVGAGFDSWSGLRYGLNYNDSAGSVIYGGTDSAKWNGMEAHNYGYLFCPYSGTNEPVSWLGAAKNGTHGGIVDRPWISTNGSNDYVLGEFKPKPARAVAVAGVYNFSLSVQPITDSTSEVRFYLIKDDNKYYFGGISIDTAKTRKANKFNAVCFAVNNSSTTLRGLKLTNIQVGLGAPITVPVAPWQDYYINTWGQLGGRTGGWKMDSSQVIGNAGIHGDSALTGWSAFRGGFDDGVLVSKEKAMIITGKLIFAGGGFDGWSGLRFGVFRHDSVGTVSGLGKDTAKWTGLENNAYGYLFCPYSGTNEPVSWLGAAKNGTHGGIVNRPWISTNGANDYVLGEYKPKPARAVAAAGTYNFTLSIQQLTDSTRELRFWVVKDDNKYYFGGTSIDTAKSRMTPSYNGICFAVNNSNSTLRSFKVQDVKLALGTAPTVPTPPWADYYINQWGQIGGRTGGWKMDTNQVIGNVGIHGDSALTSWSAFRGGMEDPVTLTTDKALVITGSMTFTKGGFDGWSGLRFGLFRHDSAGIVVGLGKDTAKWSGLENNAYGYLFTPYSGTNEPVTWTTGNATHGCLYNRTWISTYGDANGFGEYKQKPARAVADTGTYGFTIAVKLNTNGTHELRFWVIKNTNKYYFGGTTIDTFKSKITNTYNGLCFAVNNTNSTLRAFQVKDVKVSLLANLPTVPTPPWSDYYMDQWGVIAGKKGGWVLDTGQVIGNAGISGSVTNNGPVTLVGGFFDPYIPLTKKALQVTGKIKLTGGGFDGANSLRMGFFYSDSLGKLKNVNKDSAFWTGTENYQNGYLFIPKSGTNAVPSWNTGSGNWGAIVNGEWFNTANANNYVLGNVAQLPANAVAGAGTYNLRLKWQSFADGSNMVVYQLIKDDNSYSFKDSIVDRHNPVPMNKVNNFAISLANWTGSTTTALRLVDMKVAQVDGIVGVENQSAGLPMSYSLSQNYPNPFNPATTIEFALPKASEVDLVVYDVLGRQVAKLASGMFNAGYHKVAFNASRFASGVYYYSIKAGNYNCVKKLMLLK